MSGTGPRIYLATGERSGDEHAARVLTALHRANPGVRAFATGGPALRAAGASIRHDVDRCGANGLWEAAWTLPRHVHILADLGRQFRDRQYDLLIVVDYPGFHLRLAETASRAGIPVLYYIAPQLWAWGERRAGRLARAVRQLAVILPFEEPFFRQKGLPATFVGHPLLDAPPWPSRAAARAALGLAEQAPVLALFPGSRPQEVRRIWPVMRDAARQVRDAVPALEVVVATQAGLSYPGWDEWRAAGSPSAMAAADAGLCKSGTTTIQAALAGLPMVVTYRMHPVSFAAARRAVRVPWVGLVNLIAGREVSPELLQGTATPGRLARAVLPLLDRDGDVAKRQREAFRDVRDRLGTPGASDRVARMALELAA